MKIAAIEKKAIIAKNKYVTKSASFLNVKK